MVSVFPMVQYAIDHVSLSLNTSKHNITHYFSEIDYVEVEKKIPLENSQIQWNCVLFLFWLLHNKTSDLLGFVRFFP